MPGAGIEPAQRKRRGILSPLCLPVPPPGHACHYVQQMQSKGNDPNRSIAKQQAKRRAHGFSDPMLADDEGVVGVGGAFSPERVLAAYQNGIFPWSGDPVRWHCPDPRAIFWRVKLPRRFERMVRRSGFTLSFDTDCSAVIEACADHHRPQGEWITNDFIDVYSNLNEMGYVHSVEVWQGGALVGGLYGVQIGRMFAGESMFHRVTNASKVAFAALALKLRSLGIVLFDCQVINRHTHSLGAVLVSRADFLKLLHYALSLPAAEPGRWAPDASVILPWNEDSRGSAPSDAWEPHAMQRQRFWEIVDRREEGY